MRTRASSSTKANGFQVIVGALFEAAHAVLYGIAGGQEQHRYGHPGVAHAAQDLPAVTAGQHDVEDQQVVVAAQGQLLALVAIVAQVDGEACLGEFPGAGTGRCAVRLRRSAVSCSSLVTFAGHADLFLTAS